jgi:hypothetical protein
MRTSVSVLLSRWPPQDRESFVRPLGCRDVLGHEIFVMHYDALRFLPP